MTAWTTETWAMFFDLLDKGWPGKLEPGADRAYQLLLDGTSPDHVVQGLRRLLHSGQRFRPSAAEILAAARSDPSRPTFAEAMRLIFGPRGVLQARPTRRRYADAGERDRLHNEAALERANGMHPLIGAFIAAQTLDRLRGLELHDPEYGGLRRRELEQEWDRFVERIDERQIAADALPAADSRRGQLEQFNPLAFLERITPPRPPALQAANTTTEEEGPRDDHNR